jgi:dCMP deaminase
MTIDHNKPINKWDLRFLEIAKCVSRWSKDPGHKVGCVVVKDRRILSTGYNGFARGISDTEADYQNREVKLRKTIHAEMNAIFNATCGGISLNGSTFYVYGLPVCGGCAPGIIQAGAKRIVVPMQECDPRWHQSCRNAICDFEEADVEYEILSVNDVEIGKWWTQ